MGRTEGKRILRFVFEEGNARRHKSRVCGNHRRVSVPTTLVLELSRLYHGALLDRGHHQEILSLSQGLANPGELRQAQNSTF